MAFSALQLVSPWHGLGNEAVRRRRREIKPLAMDVVRLRERENNENWNSKPKQCNEKDKSTRNHRHPMFVKLKLMWKLHSEWKHFLVFSSVRFPPQLWITFVLFSPLCALHTLFIFPTKFVGNKVKSAAAAQHKCPTKRFYDFSSLHCE